MKGREVRLEFMPTNLEEERTIVSAVFGRADAWLNWGRPAAGHRRQVPDRFLGAIRGLAGMAARNVRRSRQPVQQPLPAAPGPT